MNVKQDTCPWCALKYDATFKRPAIALPCKHVGCLACLRKALLKPQTEEEREKRVRSCPLCKTRVQKYTIEGAPYVIVLEVEKEKKNTGPILLSSVHNVEMAVSKTSEQFRTERIPDMSLDEIDKEFKDPYLEPDGWGCMICYKMYDHKNNKPVMVSECYAIAFNSSDPDADRGLAPGCEHAFCGTCANRALYSDSGCYVCRSFIKSFSVDLKLLREIVAFHDGHYAGLVAANNEWIAKVDTLTKEVARMDKDNKAVVELRAELTRMTEIKEIFRSQSVAFEGQARKSKTEHDGLLQLWGKVSVERNQAVEQLKEVMTINDALFNEIITLRLQCVDEGVLSPMHFGVTYPTYLPAPMHGKTVLKVDVGPPSVRTKCLFYGRETSTLKPNDHAVLKRVRDVSDLVDEFSGNEATGREIRLPTDEELEASYLEIPRSNNQVDHETLVCRGSWLHKYILDNAHTPEATFDGPAVTDASTGQLTTGKTFQVVNKMALDAALGAHRRLMSRAAKKQKEDSRPPSPPPLFPPLTTPRIIKSARVCDACSLLPYPSMIKCNHMEEVSISLPLKLSNQSPPPPLGEAAENAISAIFDARLTSEQNRLLRQELMTTVRMQLLSPNDRRESRILNVRFCRQVTGQRKYNALYNAFTAAANDGGRFSTDECIQLILKVVEHPEYLAGDGDGVYQKFKKNVVKWVEDAREKGLEIRSSFEISLNMLATGATDTLRSHSPREEDVGDLYGEHNGIGTPFVNDGETRTERKIDDILRRRERSVNMAKWWEQKREQRQQEQHEMNDNEEVREPESIFDL